jgi:hypothetical protein
MKSRLFLLLALTAPLQAFALPVSEICNDCPPEHPLVSGRAWFVIALLVVGCYYLSKAILKRILRLFRRQKASAQPRR